MQTLRFSPSPPKRGNRFKRFSWVEWLALALLGTGPVLWLSAGWISQLISPGGGIIPPSIGPFFMLLELATFCTSLGVLLFTVRPLLRFRSWLLPLALILAAQPVGFMRTQFCTALGYSGDCELLALIASCVFTAYGVIFLFRVCQILDQEQDGSTEPK